MTNDLTTEAHLPTHEDYMRLAMQEAGMAAQNDEVPAGCVIVDLAAPLRTATAIIARAHNETQGLRNPTAHAEILAISRAAAALGNWRLTQTAIYITKEPCAMCAGAIILARIPLVVFGVPDPLRGGQSVFTILTHAQLNHRCEIVSGILETPCRDQLQSFFRERREAPSGAPPD